MIGDVLTSSILCEALKERYPDSEVHYLINSHTQAVVENNPFIDELVLYTPEIEKSRRLQKELRKTLRARKYEVVIDVYSKIGSARMAKATKAPLVIGYKKWYTKSAYTKVYTYSEQAETEAGLAIENRMKLLQGIDNSFPKAIKPKLYVTEAETAFAKAQLKKHQISNKKPLYMIGILGSSEDKTYPLSALAKVLDALILKTNSQLLFNYMPKQVDDVATLYGLCQPKTQENIKVALYGKSLREFMALTQECDALIGNEGGAVNMAKALNIPTFAIFSPWIRKAAWALYENEQNMAVHLQDIQPELYKDTPLKTLKKEVDRHYKALDSGHVIAQLDLFLQKN
ncbi:MAG: heptosyltransferase-2 [Dokdonia sp.]|jgi:heptosyltransferase-2